MCLRLLTVLCADFGLSSQNQSDLKPQLALMLPLTAHDYMLHVAYACLSPTSGQFQIPC